LACICNRLYVGLLTVARKLDQFVVAAGEASKSMAVLVPLIDDILAMGVDRSVLVVVFGGRVRRDLAGFAVTSLLRVLILYK
jgi:3-dehydroquinate synthetase